MLFNIEKARLFDALLSHHDVIEEHRKLPKRKDFQNSSGRAAKSMKSVRY